MFAHSEDDSGGQFFTVVAIGFVPALSYYLYTLSTGMGEQRPGYQTVKGDDGAGAELSTRSSAETHSASGPTNIELSWSIFSLNFARPKLCDDVFCMA